MPRVSILGQPSVAGWAEGEIKNSVLNVKTLFDGVNSGGRTHDLRNHNPTL